MPFRLIKIKYTLTEFQQFRQVITGELTRKKMDQWKKQKCVISPEIGSDIFFYEGDSDMCTFILR